MANEVVLLDPISERGRTTGIIPLVTKCKRNSCDKSPRILFLKVRSALVILMERGLHRKYGKSLALTNKEAKNVPQR
jgi:hypothetical protein